jgi:hypothetical protein
MAWCRPTPGGNTVDHINGIKTDNVYTNLRWVSKEDNLQYAKERDYLTYGVVEGDDFSTAIRIPGTVDSYATELGSIIRLRSDKYSEVTMTSHRGMLYTSLVFGCRQQFKARACEFIVSTYPEICGVPSSGVTNSDTLIQFIDGDKMNISPANLRVVN